MSEQTRQEWYLPTLPEPISHYTHAVSFGELVCVSGFTATNRDGELVGGDDVEAQTYQVLRNLEEALQAVGSSLQDILKVTVYLTDMADRQTVNIARQKMFGTAKPASTLIEISKLATPGAKVEIDAIACRSPDRAQG